MPAHERAIFLFDGPNFYKNMRNYGINRGRLDFMSLARNLAGPRSIVDVILFTSPTDQTTDAVNYVNQQRFFAAVQKRGVSLRLGKLVHRMNECPLCKGHFSLKTEKSVDVQLALAIAIGAVEDSWDVAYVVSCDSDIVPAITFARGRGKKIFSVFPEGAQCYTVGKVCNASIPVTQELVDKSQAQIELAITNTSTTLT